MNLADVRTLPDLVRRAAAEYGDRPALRWARSQGDGGLTYAQLAACMQRGSDRLAGLGLAPGARVLLVAENQPQWGPGLFAILDAGLVAVPVVPNASADALLALARQTGARAVVVSRRTAPLAAALDGLQVLELERLFTDPSGGAPAHRAADLALLALTSGTTQAPRAVELTHGNLLHDLRALLAVRHAGPGDAMLSMLPAAHMFELQGGLLGPLACGAHVVFPGALLPNRLIATLRDDHITHALAVPALVSALSTEVLDELIAAEAAPTAWRGGAPRDLLRFLRVMPNEARAAIGTAVRQRIGDAFRSLIVGGAALDPDWAPVFSTLGIDVEVGYGLTEAGPIVSVGLAAECPRGSVGRPLPGIEVRVLAGEIVVRGGNVMRGYWADPAATRAALVDGWLRTGDRGRMDDDGYIFVTGRCKEAMVTATGETIDPGEVEEHYQSPLFAEACVVPCRGAHGNDLPTLLVVPARPGLSDSELRAEFQRLRAAAPARLRVSTMRLWPRPLPRTATGKVLRRALAEGLEGP